MDPTLFFKQALMLLGDVPSYSFHPLQKGDSSTFRSPLPL